MMTNKELEEHCREAVKDYINPNWFWKLLMWLIASMGVIAWLVYWIVRHV